MIIFLLLFFSLLFSSPILASDNIFGLHLSQTEDIHSAAKVINSQGGDWGWITIVIQSKQLDQNTWQDFFDNCRKYHLIPIVRIATIGDGSNWKVPEFSDIDNTIIFLNSLNWPTKEQHVILFNEINHASEWGGKVNISDFTQKSFYAAKKFKETNPNFFVLSTALDLSAPEKAPQYRSAENVYKEIISINPSYFDYIDGLASHSYPNKGFIGSPDGSGRFSIRGYIWELDLLKKLGVTKNLPVFITETGWPHQEGIKKNKTFYSSKIASEFLIKSITQVWSSDPRVKAITPFIYNYAQEPFDHFSWLDQSGNLYPGYQDLVNLSKKQNNPEQIVSYHLEKIKTPLLILENKEYDGQLTLKNTGQSIWGEKEFCLPSTSSQNIQTSNLCSDNLLTYPGQYKIFNFKFTVKPSNNQNQTYLSWGNLDKYEIQKFAKESVLYHPKETFLQKVINSFKTFFTRNN